MTKVVSLTGKKDSQNKTDLLEVIEKLKASVEEGTTTELIFIGLDAEGEATLGAVVKDNVGGIGMFELGKMLFFQQITMG